MRNFTLKGLIALCLLISSVSKAQLPDRVLVGYWHNWNQTGIPFIELNAIDSRFNVICLSFAVANGGNPSNMQFSMWSGTSYNNNDLIADIAAAQSQGKVVLMSVGGANGSFRLTSTADKDGFVADMKDIISTYGVDGIDIDLEQQSNVCMYGGTIDNPTDVHVTNMIAALQELLAWYQTTYNKKMILTMAPETVYVEGAMSSWAVNNACGGSYLPIIEALRDDLDLLMVQLYNSGSMYGLDNAVYSQGTAGFVTSQIEAIIRGFNAAGGLGTFDGFPAYKVAVALPACSSSGSGALSASTLTGVMNYLIGEGPKVGTYTLLQSGGYPGLRGMMTWSINNDALSNCGSTYEYAGVYEDVFDGFTGGNAINEAEPVSFQLYPNPTASQLNIVTTLPSESIQIVDLTGQVVQVSQGILGTNTIDVSALSAGTYFVKIGLEQSVFVKK